MKKSSLETIAKKTLDCSYKVHTALGPGLLESAYEVCLVYELNQENLETRSQQQLPIIYDGVKIDAGYRIDIIVEDELILEIKSIDRVLPVHKAQLLSYLRLSNKRLGLLLNFNEQRLVHGIKRIVNEL